MSEKLKKRIDKAQRIKEQQVLGYMLDKLDSPDLLTSDKLKKATRTATKTLDFDAKTAKEQKDLVKKYGKDAMRARGFGSVADDKEMKMRFKAKGGVVKMRGGGMIAQDRMKPTKIT